ncbi:DUF2161 domain-containing phosphodiesterase [Pseudaestuariivita sp.]|uniref:DUF2161 domain-containing phosphodiesterase n=1 Tax=Pseudaestuariivita sp. TaxID=2211669 RepID=UPI0040581AD5
MTQARETDLYPPIKAHFEALGFVVKGEVGAADVVAQRGETLVVVELKLGFSLTLLHQAVQRQRVTDDVYVAVPRWRGKAGWKAFKANIGLARRLGLGVLSVDPAGLVQEHCAPGPFQPRKSKLRKSRLTAEFARRMGDPSPGGSNRQGLVTAYRQEAWRCARHLEAFGPSKGAEVAKAAQVPKATRVMADNHFGWFERVARGHYALTDVGRTAVQQDRAAHEAPVV